MIAAIWSILKTYIEEQVGLIWNIVKIGSHKVE